MINSIALTGPTASGKTAFSIALAKKIGAEIISCDSMQIYKHMNIGTAKATDAERSEIKHYLIDFLSPADTYSTELYRKAALASAAEISAKGKIPLFAGGTGLYIDTLIRAPQSNVPESSVEYREKILAEIKTEEDIHSLWQRLYEVDTEAAEKIHERNLRRVIRALEIFETTGIPKSVLDRKSKNAVCDISVDMITLDFHNRENLYSRINARVDSMMEAGLVAEVEGLLQKGFLGEGSTAAQAIGYKEILMLLRGEIGKAEATELIKLSTRRYAKRQLTWFRHTDAERVYLDDECGIMRRGEDVFSEICDTAEKYIKGFCNESKRA